MSKTEQSSIEWLIQNIVEDQTIKSKSMSEWIKIFDNSKVMHKEEICQFVSDYLDDAADDMTAEEYYDQIYKDDIP